MTIIGMLIAAVVTHAGWADGPVRHLMTKDEIAQWETLRTDDEAQAFIGLFWARRDPTPDTPHNELKEEFEVRVALADQHFTTTRTRGAMSDRGRVLILLGPPFRMGGTGAGRTAEPNRNPGPGAGTIVDLAGPRPISARMVWTYTQERMPPFVKRKDLEILFVDERGGGEWELATTERVSPERILQQAINHYIVSPKLATAPSFTEKIPTSFNDPRLKSAYEKIRLGQEGAPVTAHLTWGEFVTPSGDRFVPVQIYVPASTGIEAGRELTLFGVVENSAGEIVQVIEAPATLSASGPDTYVSRSLRLEPGKYSATFGLAKEGQPLAATTADITVEGIDARQSGTSPLILSTNIVPLQEAYGPEHPFVFGGLNVVAKGDATFTPRDNLWYFTELRNPGLTEEGAPRVEAKVDIEGQTADRKVRMNFPRQAADIAPLRGVENRYAVGTAIPLETFPPGDYKIRVQLFDMVQGTSYKLERSFRVAAP